MGKYQNASKGLNNLFLAEVFVICDAIIGIAMVALALLGGDPGIPDWVLTVDVIIAQVLGLVGVYLLSKDAPEVKSAFYLKVAALALAVISGVIALANRALGETVASWVNTIAGIIDLFVLYRVLKGAGRLCAECGRADIQKSGKTIWVLKVVGIVGTVVATILGAVGLAAGMDGAETAGGILLLVTGVLSIALVAVGIVASIKYILFLYKGYKALGQDA